MKRRLRIELEIDAEDEFCGRCEYQFTGHSTSVEDMIHCINPQFDDGSSRRVDGRRLPECIEAEHAADRKGET